MRQTAREKFALLLVLATLLLAACSSGGEKQTPERTILTLVSLNPYGINPEVRKAVEKYNRSQNDVKIIMKDYWGKTEEEQRQNQEQLRVEIASGQMPDILDIGSSGTIMKMLPYRQLAVKGYLEDLWPYIEKDPEISREDLVESPLKAAEVNGGLYMAFNSVRINSLVGATRVVGDRQSWSMEDLWEAYASMPEDSFVMDFYLHRYDFFLRVLPKVLDSYVDFETGQCTFDCKEFRTILEFAKNFPAEFQEYTDEEFNEEFIRLMREHKQMLTRATGFSDLQLYRIIYGEPISFIGYPTEDGSVGSSFAPYGNKLAISTSCKDKEAAWQVVRQLLLPRYKKEVDVSRDYGFLYDRIPINRQDYDFQKKVFMSSAFGGRSLTYFGITVSFHKATKEEYQQYEELISQIDTIDIYDTTLLDLVYEICGPYFAGDKTLDETIDLIQSRVKLYVNEVR